MNEVQVLKWLAIGISSGTVLFTGAAWGMLFFLRKKVRHDRQVRQEKQKQEHPPEHALTF